MPFNCPQLRDEQRLMLRSQASLAHTLGSNLLMEIFVIYFNALLMC
jgi:hypothetical protein